MINIFESAFSLKNTKILVTGASSGIGREIAILELNMEHTSMHLEEIIIS